MGHVPLSRSARVLELGSGDGFQLDLLRQRFQRVFAIDPERRPTRHALFSFSAAEALPFPDGAFDLIVSCCVTEHLSDRVRAMNEAARVLRPGGYMAHIVPSRFWKAASLFLNPVGYPLRVFEKWQALRRIKAPGKLFASKDSEVVSRPSFLQVLGRWIYPVVHGTYASHFAEYRSYARRRWVELFTHVRLVPVAEIPLLSYTQFGFARFRLLGVRRWLAQHGFASSHAFIFRKG